MRDLTLSELRVVSGGQAEEEPPRILDTITVRGTRPATRPFPSFSYPTGPIGMETGEVLHVGEQHEEESWSRIAALEEGATVFDVNGNPITLADQDPSENRALNSLDGLYVADEYGQPVGSPFGPGHTVEGVDEHGANGVEGADGIADSLNTMIDDGLIVAGPYHGT